MGELCTGAAPEGVGSYGMRAQRMLHMGEVCAGQRLKVTL